MNPIERKLRNDIIFEEQRLANEKDICVEKILANPDIQKILKYLASKNLTCEVCKTRLANIQRYKAAIVATGYPKNQESKEWVVNELATEDHLTLCNNWYDALYNPVPQ